MGTTCTKAAGMQLSGNSYLVSESLGTARIPSLGSGEIECYHQSCAKEDIECVLHVSMVVQFTVK